MSGSENLEDTAKRKPLVMDETPETPRTTRPPSSASQRLEALKGANERVSLLLEQMLAAEEAERADLVESAKREDPTPIEIPNIDIARPTEGDELEGLESTESSEGQSHKISHDEVLEAKMHFDRLDAGSGSMSDSLRRQGRSEGFFGTIGASVARLLHLDK